MNKTIIININGMVFHIEEDAYEILKNYMTDVKRHFYNSQDSLEITTDIENRIAEMFNEILANGHKQVIIETDVTGVIEQMGTVEDFEQAEEEAPAAAHNPYNAHANTGSRSLFRDSDDHLVAGVCAGLANFFDIKPIWVRLVFALAIAFFGIGLIPYIILWLIIPKAKTRADRMAMKGEKLNLQGFKNNFEEELSEARHDAKPAVYKVRDFFSDLFFHSGRFFKVTGKVLVKLLGILILLSCLGGIIAFIILFALATVFGKESVDIFPFNVIDNQYSGRLYTSAFITVVLPIIAIALLTISAVFNVRTVGKSSAAIILAGWLFSLGAMIFYISKAGAEFRSSASFDQTLAIKPTLKNKYYLKINDVKYLTSEDSTRLNIKANLTNVIVTNDDGDNDGFNKNNMSIRIERSDVNQPVLVQSFSAKGASYDDALSNARNTHYTFVQQDTILKFDRVLQRLNGTRWRDQRINLTLKVPLNTVLVIDEEMDRYLRDGINIWDCKNKNKRSEDNSAPFIMTANGLECKVDTLVTIPDSVKIPNPKLKRVKVK